MVLRLKTYGLKQKRNFLFSSIFSIVLLFSCVEPYTDTEFIESFEDVLVINATITNQDKQQEVNLSRSFRFDDESIPPEEGASVTVIDDLGNSYAFEERIPGSYISEQTFAAEFERTYQLKIITASGNRYSSNPMKMAVPNTNLDEVYAERITNDDSEEGIGIFVNSFDPDNSSKLYRHEFIETFKIIAPFWSPFDAVVITEGRNTFEVRAILREQEERVCYGEQFAKNILVNSTVGLNEDRLTNYNIRFINRDNYIISHRYSVLVKQYVQSEEAFSYYETLSGLSQGSENIFSEDQPGFIQGNIFSDENRNENVAGFFDVVPADEKRIFFNYEDFFPNEELPPYTADCVITAPTTTGTLGERELLNLIYDDKIRFYDFNRNTIPGGGPFLVVRKDCGDCTTLGSNKIPEFWIE